MKIHHLSRFLLAICLLPCHPIVTSAETPTCKDLGNKKREAFGFRPTELSSEEQAAKGEELDAFWNLAKGMGRGSIPCLRSKLQSEKSDPFFSFDASQLLFMLDPTEPSLEVISEALLLVDLDEIDVAAYLDLSVALSKKEVNIGPLANKYLAHPRVDAFVAQHSLRIDRATGAMFLYGSMPDADAIASLRQASQAGEPDAKRFALVRLASILSEGSFQAVQDLSAAVPVQAGLDEILQSFTTRHPVQESEHATLTREEVMEKLRKVFWMSNLSEEEEQRNTKERIRILEEAEEAYEKGGEEAVQEVLDELVPQSIAGHKDIIASAIAHLTEEDLPLLRETRRKAIYSISDEALYEYDALTAIMLGVINRLDLYSEYRSPKSQEVD